MIPVIPYCAPRPHAEREHNHAEREHNHAVGCIVVVVFALGVVAGAGLVLLGVWVAAATR